MHNFGQPLWAAPLGFAGVGGGKKMLLGYQVKR